LRPHLWRRRLYHLPPGCSQGGVSGLSSLGSGELVLGFLFGGAVGLLALDLELWLLLVEFHELGQVELGLLEQLDLADEHVLEGEDLVALLHDLLANSVLDAKIY
jgi:hypothetical protein